MFSGLFNLSGQTSTANKKTGLSFGQTSVTPPTTLSSGFGIGKPIGQSTPAAVKLTPQPGSQPVVGIQKPAAVSAASQATSGYSFGSGQASGNFSFGGQPATKLDDASKPKQALNIAQPSASKPSAFGVPAAKPQGKDLIITFVAKSFATYH